MYDNEVDEKEATAYLFRRNFATILHILGLNQNEIEYLMGHKIASDFEKRNYYSNIVKLYPIKEKMDNRPLFSNRYTSSVIKKASYGTDGYFENPYEQKIIIQGGLEPGEIELFCKALAPGTDVEIKIMSSEKNPVINYSAYSSMVKRDNNERTTSVLKAVHREYESITSSKSASRKKD